MRSDNEPMSCSNCSTKKTNQFWHLRGYYGISGAFCSKCYDCVSHDAYGRPQNPQAYARIKAALNAKKGQTQ
jgi:hypothetical protein